MHRHTEFADYIYKIVESELEGFDAIYEDYIINLVGFAGLNALRLHKYIESCGIVEGRQLYALCGPKGGVSNGRLG